MAMRMKLRKGGEVTLSVSKERDSVILLTEHALSIMAVELTATEAKQLGESLLSVAAVARA